MEGQSLSEVQANLSWAHVLPRLSDEPVHVEVPSLRVNHAVENLLEDPNRPHRSTRLQKIRVRRGILRHRPYPLIELVRRRARAEGAARQRQGPRGESSQT